MSDYSISTQITLDDSKFTKGVKNAQNSTKKLSSVISNVTKGFGKGGLVGSITSAGLALGGIGLAVGTAIKAFQKISKTIGECSEAFKKQEKAEIALETAIKNSSVVTDVAVKSLKEYASELQRTTNLGDEEILPMMTQLIATGRTEAEVMQIIATASDMSATGTISFDTAVTQLNATLNGNIGRLGQQNAELKGLTEEELKNGKAVEILAGKYKGLAEATVDTKKQLKNAIGDLKESFGAVFEKALDPMRKFFAEIIQGWADARKAKQKYEESTEAIEQGKGTIEQIQTVIEERQKGLEELKNELAELEAGGEDWAEMLKEEISLTKERIKQTERELGILNAKLTNKQRQEELEKKIAQEQSEQAEREKTVADLKEKYLEKIAEQEARWRNIQIVTGEVVDTEEKIKFYEDNLVSIMTESGGQITKNNQYYKDQLAIIQELQKEIQTPAEEKDTSWEKRIREQAIERLEAQKEVDLELLEEEGRNAEQRLAIEREYNARLMQLNLERIQEERAEALKSAKTEEEKMQIVEYYQNLIIENARKYSQTVTKIEKNAGKEVQKSWKEAFADVVKTMSKATEKIKGAMGKAVTFIKNTFGAIKNVGGVLSKVFSFNTDDALDSLLAFEDKILTFFVETLPKLPAFFASAMQSISVLLQNVLNSDTFNALTDIFLTIVDTLTKALPDLIAMLFPIVEKIIDSIMDLFGNTDFVDRLLDLIEQATDWLARLIETRLPVILNVIIKIIKKITAKTPELLKIIIPALGEAIRMILEALPEINKIAMDSLPQIFREVLPILIVEIMKLVPVFIQVVVDIAVEIIKHLPEIVWAIIQGLYKAFKEVDWGKFVKKCFMGFINGFKKLFGIHSPSTVFEGFGKNIVEGFEKGIEGLKKLFSSMGDWAKTAWNGIENAFSKVGDWAKNVVDNIKEGFGELTDWFKNLGKDIYNGVEEAFDKVADGAKEVGEAVGEAVEDATDGSITGSKEGDVALAVATGGLSVGINALGKKLGWWANGTQNATRGLAVVGEAGPELVKFNGGEQVLNNRNTNKALANMGKGGNVFNVTFENTVDTTAFAMMKQLRQYQRNLAFNGVL